MNEIAMELGYVREQLRFAMEELEEKERLDDALRDILDVTTGWSRFKNAEDKLEAISRIAKEALA